MTAREPRRQRLAAALRHVERAVAGKWARANRQEWAASRVADGWSEKIVRDAISAGALAAVRAQIQESNGARPVPERLLRAMRALSIVDEQRNAATRQGNNVKPHRPGGLPPRVRE